MKPIKVLKKISLYKVILSIWILFLLGFGGFILFVCGVNNNWNGWFGQIPSLEVLDNPKSELSSEIYTMDGVLMGKYHQVNRTPVSYEDISPNVIHALVATEDARFEAHAGVDLKGLMRVFFKTIILQQRSSGGGSTITQQLAKNLFKTRGEASSGSLSHAPGLRMPIIKVKEWLTAIEIEKRYTKKEIITMYLNESEFGSNSYGIQVACKTFFGKGADEVNVQEAAMLVGLLKAPTKYSPVLNPESALQRRNTVLNQMRKYNFLSEDQYETLKKIPIELNYKVENHIDGIAPYFRAEASKFLNQWAKDHNYNLYTDGLKIYTTIDSRMQKHAEETVIQHMIDQQKTFDEHWKGRNPWIDKWGREIPDYIDKIAKRTPQYRYLKKEFGEEKALKMMRKPVKMKIFTWEGEKDTLLSPIDSIKHHQKFLNIGMVSIEPNTGHIKAWVGGIDFKYFKYDHVYQGKRQPGSTFKPILYAAAIDNGYTPCYRLKDQQVDVDGWKPKNSDGKFSGEYLTLRQAIGRSINSIAAQLIKEITPEIVVKYARNFGIKSDLMAVPSIALGTFDVSLFELMGPYCTFANKGYRTKPLFITKITDKNGKVLAEFFPEVRAVLSEENAYIMLHMLQGSLKEKGGTSLGLYSPVYGGITQNNEIGAKTGTTQDNSDGWFVGVTKGLVTGIWVGGDSRNVRFRSIYYGQGAKMALPAWGKYMEKVYEDLELFYTKGSFPRPRDLSIELDCAKFEKEEERGDDEAIFKR